MLDIAALMLPILLLIGLGLLAVKIGLASPAHVEGVGAYVLNIALPAVLLLALARQDFASLFNPGYVLAYGAGSLATFLIVLAFLRLWLKSPLEKAAMGAMGGSMSNSGFIGFPITTLAFGDVALLALPLSMLVENILIMPLAIILMEGALSGAGSVKAVLRQTAARLSRMPILLVIVAGVALSLLGIQLPGPVVQTLDMLAASSAPAALFVVGGAIASLRATDMGAEIAPVVIGKLLVHPLAVTAAFFLVPGVPAELVAVGIVLSSVSMVTIYPVLSRRVGMESAASATLIVATCMALLTIPVALVLVSK